MIPNVTAEPETAAERLREALVRQVTAPVRWVETVRRLEAMGVRILVEVGPGRILSGLARRIAPGLRTLNVEDPGTLAGTVAALQEAAAGGGA